MQEPVEGADGGVVSRTAANAIVSDLVVIGGGPAGIAAAVRAAECGLQVVLLDRGLAAGGQIWRHRDAAAAPRTAQRWLTRLARSGARIVTGASVADAQCTADGVDVLAHTGDGALRIRAGKLIIATGARELLIPFEGWTLPGVMGIGGVQALLKSGVSFARKRVVIAGSGPLILPVAASLAGAGAKLVLVAEQASRASVARFVAGLWRAPSILAQAARYRAQFITTSYSTGRWVTAASGTGQLRAVTMTDGRLTWRVGTDLLCTGYGLVPNVELARLLGCEVRDGAVVVDEYQRTTIPNVLAAGEVTGVGGAPLALIEGEMAGLTAALRESDAATLSGTRRKLVLGAVRMLGAFAPRAELRSLPTDGTVVCRCEDVSYAAVRNASCARQAKLYTRVGMGPCQGRTCMPGLEFLLAWQPDTVRPPLEPAPISVLSSETADATVPARSIISSEGDVYQ